MAHEFSVALRARGAVLLPHGALPRVENPLPALRTHEVPFRSHARKGTRRDPPSRLAAMAHHDPLTTESAEDFVARKSRQCDLVCRRSGHEFVAFPFVRPAGQRGSSRTRGWVESLIPLTGSWVSVRPGRFNPKLIAEFPNLEDVVALTQTQLVAAVAERADLSKADAKRALGALDDIVLEELGDAQKVRIGGLVQLTVRVKPAQKKRKGRNPATGEEIDIAAKPASVDLRARPLAKAKGALPSVQKARRRLAA